MKESNSLSTEKLIKHHGELHCAVSPPYFYVPLSLTSLRVSADVCGLDSPKRFRFCGGLEPPDWLLAEIPLLAALDEAHAVAACDSICSDHDETAMDDVPQLSPQDAQATLAVLRFVLLQGAKYNISERELAVELLQLGIRRELSDSIAAVYGVQRLKLRERLQANSFKFPTIEQLKWRVHHTNPSDSEASTAARVEMRLQLDRQPLLCESPGKPASIPPSDSTSAKTTLAMQMTEDKFLALYEELSQAHALLQSLKRA